MIGGFAALAFAAPAMAQDAPASQDLDDVIVTGSRIPQTNLVTTSPVTQVTGEDIDVAGVTRVEDLISQLPQAFAAQNSTVSNGASGTATVSLRNLGSSRALVLIDGRRMGYGSPNDDAADLNQIPEQLVERVEVLTGGASAIYGSDAIAGVVNFIMKKDFEGLQIDAQYGFYQHNNDYDGVGNVRAEIARRALTNPAQFQLP
ncbi:MAG: TonB-dependent receptor plug domain-containing protein, partial [Alphaproteobacteria bacterium]|nr:TonB-dependent receptor plug domain-containing protein [Alphaproteobacteria bacterium]